MENDVDPDPNKRNPAFAILWLLIGLAPIPILLSLMAFPSPRRSSFGYVFVFCTFCNLAGGFGCVAGIKDVGARIGLGILLAIFFFLLSWGIVLFQACSHMSI